VKFRKKLASGPKTQAIPKKGDDRASLSSKPDHLALVTANARACVSAGGVRRGLHKYSYRISVVISAAIAAFRYKKSRGIKTSTESLSHTSRNRSESDARRK